MKNILHLLKKEVIQTLRDKKILPLLLIAPIIQLFVLGFATNNDLKDVSLLICDLDKSQSSYEFISQFSNSGYFTIVKTTDSPKIIDEYLINGIASVALVIPTDFSKNMINKRTASIQAICDGTDANSANIALGFMKQIIAKYNQEKINENIIKSAKIVNLPTVSMEPRILYNSELKSANFMVPGVIGLILMIVTSTMTSLSIVKEKELGTLEQLIVTPIKRYQLILGKIIPFSLFGLVDITLITFFAIVIFQVPFRGNFFLLILLSSLYILTTLGLGLFVSTISKTQQQAQMTSIFFIMLPFIFLSGFTFPVENMPDSIRFLTNFVPLKYFIIIIRDIFLKGSDFIVLWKETVILFIFGISIFSISVIRLHKKLE